MLTVKAKLQFEVNAKDCCHNGFYHCRLNTALNCKVTKYCLILHIIRNWLTCLVDSFSLYGSRKWFLYGIELGRPLSNVFLIGAQFLSNIIILVPLTLSLFKSATNSSCNWFYEIFGTINNFFIFAKLYFIGLNFCKIDQNL